MTGVGWGEPTDGKPVLSEMRDAALLEESDEVTQPLGGFGQVATTVSCEPRAIFS